MKVLLLLAMSKPPVKLVELMLWLPREASPMPVTCRRPPLKLTALAEPPKLASLLMLNSPAVEVRAAGIAVVRIGEYQDAGAGLVQGDAAGRQREHRAALAVIGRAGGDDRAVLHRPALEGNGRGGVLSVSTQVERAGGQHGNRPAAQTVVTAGQGHLAGGHGGAAGVIVGAARTNSPVPCLIKATARRRSRC